MFCVFFTRFDYERYIKYLEDINLALFHTFLPIQLDASCNGYKHICLITREAKAFKQLNLLASTKKDAPEDFYNFILLSVRDYIKVKLTADKFVEDN